MRDWKPTDHDREDPAKAPAPQVRQTKAVDDEPELIELAWSKNCVRCHGALGGGDGPQAAMTHPPDLTQDSFLSSVSDQDIEGIIRGGKNEMPAFGQLPDRAISGLIKRIRAKGHPPQRGK